MVKIIKAAALVFCLLMLTACAATGEWGEEVTYVRLENGTNTMDWIVWNGDLMKPVANHGTEEFDFSSCKTGDVLQMEIYLIQEIFPANAVYTRCETTGKSAEVEMKDEYKAWMTEVPDSVWTITE